MKAKKIPKIKTRIIEQLVRYIKEYPIIAVVNMENLPAPQLQKMRAQLRGRVIMMMTKKNLMKLALKQGEPLKKGIEKLSEHLTGMPALLFTKDNPFKLAKILDQNKSNAPAKGGQTAPTDIVVPAGGTGFSPGPIISQLAGIGLKTAIENGKIAIKADAIVVKEGEEIPANVAEILARLKIEPMEIGLSLNAVYEAGDIFTGEILSVDDKEYEDNFKKAASMAFNLAFNSGYPTKETIELMIIKAYNDSKALAISEDLITDETVSLMVEKAQRSMLGLKNTINYEVKTEEKPQEEKKEEKTEDDKEEVKEETTEKKEEEKPQEESKKEVEVSQKPTTNEDLKQAEKNMEQIQKNALKK